MKALKSNCCSRLSACMRISSSCERESDRAFDSSLQSLAPEDPDGLGDDCGDSEDTMLGDSLDVLGSSGELRVRRTSERTGCNGGRLGRRSVASGSKSGAMYLSSSSSGSSWTPTRKAVRARGDSTPLVSAASPSSVHKDALEALGRSRLELVGDLEPD